MPSDACCLIGDLGGEESGLADTGLSRLGEASLAALSQYSCTCCAVWWYLVMRSLRLYAPQVMAPSQ